MKFSLFLVLLLSTQVWAKWSVTTFNIRNFDSDHNAGRTNLVELEKIIKSVESDVFAFEEVVNVEAFKTLMKKVLPTHDVRLSGCGGFGQQRLAIVYRTSKFRFITQTEDLSFSGSGNTACGSLRPILLVTLESIQKPQQYTFGAVHLKAGGDERAFRQRWAQYDKLTKLVQDRANQNLILMGDFNTTGYNIKNEDFTRFQGFLNSSTMRTMTENIDCTNYWSPNSNKPELQPSILDHVVIPESFVKDVTNVSVASHCAALDCRPATAEDLGLGFESVSDHCPVQVTFK